MESSQKGSFRCGHGTLVVMSQLASGASDQKKYQHEIQNSSGNLIIVIQGKVKVGDTLVKCFNRIMNNFNSTGMPGKKDKLGTDNTCRTQQKTQ